MQNITNQKPWNCRKCGHREAQHGKVRHWTMVLVDGVETLVEQENS